MRNRIFTLAGATVVAAGLAACASNPMQPVASYPSTPVYPSVSTAPSTSYPSASTAQTVPNKSGWVGSKRSVRAPYRRRSSSCRRCRKAWKTAA